MRILILLAALGLAVASSNPVAAAPKKAIAKKSQKAKGKAAKPRGDLKTDVRFDDSVLYGEYQSPQEAVARVENEKGLSDLLGVRKHFKDRLSEAAEQE
ncbi:MAG: hypothetical protein KF799_09855 [Bdellovibrionales bacterium]|nr:hypothetical protein [Bdellovibrionales bacterium]